MTKFIINHKRLDYLGPVGSEVELSELEYLATPYNVYLSRVEGTPAVKSVRSLKQADKRK